MNFKKLPSHFSSQEHQLCSLNSDMVNIWPFHQILPPTFDKDSYHVATAGKHICLQVYKSTRDWQNTFDAKYYLDQIANTEEFVKGIAVMSAYVQ